MPWVSGCCFLYGLCLYPAACLLTYSGPSGNCPHCSWATIICFLLFYEWRYASGINPMVGYVSAFLNTPEDYQGIVSSWLPGLEWQE